MKTQYKVIMNYTASDLAQKVNAALANGWELQGGVSMAITPGGSFYFAQALIKKS